MNGGQSQTTELIKLGPVINTKDHSTDCKGKSKKEAVYTQGCVHTMDYYTVGPQAVISTY